MIELYELAGSDAEVRFSPYVWRVRMALLHKGLAFNGLAWRFCEKVWLEKTCGGDRVPVIRDGDAWVKDSHDIAVYLDETYDGPRLFGAKGAAEQARLMEAFVTTTVLMPVFPMIAADVCACLDADSAAYFRKTREQVLGRTLEEARADRESRLDSFRAGLAPLRMTLKGRFYFSGDTPAWADYVVFGCFMWSRIVSPFELLDSDDVLHAWRERMLDAFGGHARSARLGYTDLPS